MTAESAEIGGIYDIGVDASSQALSYLLQFRNGAEKENDGSVERRAVYEGGYVDTYE